MDGFQMRSQGLSGVFFDFIFFVDVQPDGRLVFKIEATREGQLYRGD